MHRLIHQKCDFCQDKQGNLETFIAALLRAEEGNEFPEKALLVFNISAAPPFWGNKRCFRLFRQNSLLEVLGLA